MDAILYTAMNGARQTLDEQSVVTHNLSNASTTGFRAQLAAARAVPVNGAGVLDTRVAAVTVTGLFDTSAGAIQTTERDLDVALDQANWLAVQMPDGEAYTKRGDLQIDADGQLMVNGMPVLGDGGRFYYHWARKFQSVTTVQLAVSVWAVMRMSWFRLTASS